MSANELPADWMIQRAIEISYKNKSPGGVTVDYAKRTANSTCDWLINLAHYVGEHESAPVDPDLLTAREAFAQVVSEDKDYGPNPAADVRAGLHDDTSGLATALRAIKLYKEKTK